MPRNVIYLMFSQLKRDGTQLPYAHPRNLQFSTVNISAFNRHSIPILIQKQPFRIYYFEISDRLKSPNSGQSTMLHLLSKKLSLELKPRIQAALSHHFHVPI